MRVFRETNVLVSAFATRGICADLLEIVLLHHDLVAGRHVLREVERAMRRNIRLPAARTAEIIALIGGEATVVVDAAGPTGARVEAADALVPGEAKQGEAEVFVTGDARLLKLGTLEALRIVSPRRFWELLHTANR